MTPTFRPNDLVINTLSNGTEIKCRIVGQPLDETTYRVVDVRERPATDKQLIARGKTWAAPASRLKLA